MEIGKSIKKAIDECDQGDFESAMLHACNAIDGTGKKVFPNAGVGQRFKQLLRENHYVLGPMGMPGIDIVNTRFPVTIRSANAQGGGADLADVIYAIHRCSHGHGDELPQGYALVEEDAVAPGFTRTMWERERVRLSHRIIWGMLGVAVMEPANLGQTVPEGYHFTFGKAGYRLDICNWWGQKQEFPALAALEPVSLVTMNFSEWGYPPRTQPSP